jgi:hypothetical protein
MAFYKLLFFGALIFTSGCSVFDCESEKIGSTNLLESSASFLSYKNNDKVTFRSNKNNEVTFTIERTDQVSKICTKILCKAINDPFKSPPCEFFETEAISAIFKTADQSMIMSISVNVDLFKAESELFFDVLAASLNKDLIFIEGRYGIEAHFAEPAFEREKLFFAAEMKLEKEFEINSKLYKDVYVSGIAPNRLFIQNQIGIIGYELNGETFELK